ncbi:MAG: hypothetical protein HFH15_11895 [Ruminococcus sp.]|jgi:hypothetical protein|nr:hypothetical protein [Ruminococcus sp.]
MNEIGGYMELEYYHLPMLHEAAIALNCGRNCLAYLLEARKISKIALPYFLCDAVRNVCYLYGVEVRYYHITEEFIPEYIVLEPGEWIYVVNYYGQLTTQQLMLLSDQYEHIIVDQAHAYFMPPVIGADTLYTCRKFFGVPDGAFLYTDSFLNRELAVDKSFERMKVLLGRFEESASEFYKEYVNNEQHFDSEPVKQMSKLTNNLLHSIDYTEVKRQRSENYAYLAEKLGTLNSLTLRNVQGAYAYPLLLQNASVIRERLIKEKVYIPILWPNVLKDSAGNTLEYHLAKNILPLPCDQRYDKKDMDYFIRLLLSD